MNRKRLVIAVVLLPVAGIVLELWPLKPIALRPPVDTKPSAGAMPSPGGTFSPAPGPTAAAKVAAPNVRRAASVGKILSVLATPISFYGRVVDQNGEAVPGAAINYSALDKFDAPGSQYKGVSDNQGNFTISGIGGAVLNVGVRKTGYYMIDGKSAASFAYGVGPDPTRRQPPSKEEPAIFILQKMGVTEPLIAISSRTFLISRDGRPVAVDLRTGKTSFQGDLRVEAWTDDQNQDDRRHYDWRCRVSVPNGGLAERRDQFAFEAPSDGYKPWDEIEVSKNADRWQSQAKRDYFLKLPDGCYARVQFRMIAGGDHFFRLESYLNPKVGSRNLEFDPDNSNKP
jgi:hypothetical protein